MNGGYRRGSDARLWSAQFILAGLSAMRGFDNYALFWRGYDRRYLDLICKNVGPKNNKTLKTRLYEKIEIEKKRLIRKTLLANKEKLFKSNEKNSPVKTVLV